MKIQIERYYPVFFATIVTIGLFSTIPDAIQKKEFLDKVSDNAITIFVTLFGFFLTILTIINSIETRRMTFVKSAGIFPRVLKYLSQSIRFSAYSIIASFVIKFLYYQKASWLNYFGINLIDFGYLFLCIFSSLLSFRFTNIFISLLSDPKNKEQTKASKSS